MMTTTRTRTGLLVATGLLLACSFAAAGDPATNMYGNTTSRNMVSDEEGLPAKWDVKTGLNVKWVADLGSQTYAGPSGCSGGIKSVKSCAPGGRIEDLT